MEISSGSGKVAALSSGQLIIDNNLYNVKKEEQGEGAGQRDNGDNGTSGAEGRGR